MQTSKLSHRRHFRQNSKNKFLFCLPLIFSFSFLIASTLAMAQKICLPKTKMEDEKLNFQIGVALKEHYENNKVSAGFKQVQAEYLRHSIVTDWKEYKNEKDEVTKKSIELSVGIKVQEDCKIVSLAMMKELLDEDLWGELKIRTSLIISEASKYEKPKTDCDCLMNLKDWLNRPVPVKTVAAAPKESPQTNPVTSAPSVAVTPSHTSAASVTPASQEAEKLIPFNKKKAGYYSVKNTQKIITEEGYKVKGVKDGEVRFFNNTGVLEYVYTYKSNFRDGFATEYYPSGKAKAEGNYKNNKKDGEWKIFYESGTLNFLGNYKSDKQEGEWHRYRQDGKYVGTDVYENGVKQ